MGPHHSPNAAHTYDWAKIRAEIEQAHEALSPVIRQTVLAPFRALTERTGVETLLKAEHRQVGGSFKIRGAYNRMLHLTDEQKAAGVIAASAGNHAQGVALAASHLGLDALVYMPANAALPKVDATRTYGAQVHLTGANVDAAIAAAHEEAAATGRIFIHPFDHWDVVIGQATVGLEILQQRPDVGTIIVPTGGGGLLAGVLLAVQAFGSQAQVIGVQAEGAAAYPRSLALGAPTPAETIRTMADGIAVGKPGDVPFEIIAAARPAIRTVTEAEIARSVLALVERAKMVIEPAGAAGVAALLSLPHQQKLRGPVVVITSGGNVDPLVLMRIMQHGMVAAGRYLELHLRMSDSPGQLAQLLAELAQLGANIHSVAHRRISPTLSVGQVDVELELEARGLEHCALIEQHVVAAGYEVLKN